MELNPALATDSAFIVAGLVLLYFGAQLLVKGSEQLGYKLGFDTLVVGITFVAFGTSAPELAITLDAVITGNPDLALANIIGSNLANICLVLGLTTFLGTVALSGSGISRDMGFMLLSFLVLSIFLADSSLNRLEGLALFLGLVGYLGFRITHSKRKGVKPEIHAQELSYSRCLAYVFLGAFVAGAGDKRALQARFFQRVYRLVWWRGFPGIVTVMDMRVGQRNRFGSQNQLRKPLGRRSR